MTTLTINRARKQPRNLALTAALAPEVLAWQ